MAKDVFWGDGAFTSRSEQLVVEWLSEHSADTDLFVDVGAYSGLFSLVAIKSGARSAVAFEIVPENFLSLVENIVANNMVRQITPFLCGIGDEHAVVRVPGVGHLSSRPTSISLAVEVAAGVDVPVQKIDSYNFQGRMIWKIDVEGFEWDVIKSGIQTIRKEKPHIICEILPEFAHCSEITETLRPLGYRFLLATSLGLVERDLAPDPAYRDWVFLAPR